MAEPTDQEPSIEEILASIREIISDDDQPAKPEVADAPAPAPVPEAAPAAEAPAENDDILDLAAFAEEPKPVVVPEEDQADPLAGINFEKPKEQTVDFTDPLAVAEAAPEPEPAPESEPVAAVPEPAPAPVAGPVDSLIGDAAKSASVESLTKLAQNIAISRKGDGGTLEDIVRDMLKPMLRQWLDTNLPPMIERMVERELERLVKQAMDR